MTLPLAAAPARATTPPPASELYNYRTASSRTYDNHDGTYTTKLYSGPVHYRDDQGVWRPISSELVSTVEPGYTWQNEANSFHAFFSSQLGDDYLELQTPRSARSFQLSLSGAAASSAQAHARGLTYPGVFPGVDLSYDLRPDGIKESLLLANAQAPISYHFLLRSPVGGHIHAAHRPDGSWAFLMRPHGRPAFVLQAPWAAEQGSPVPDSPHASLDVTPQGSNFDVELTIDSDWLHDPLRQFPVEVDPTITFQPDFQDASFNFACSTCTGVTDQRLSIGTTSITGVSQTWRSALQFDLGDIPSGTTVTSANLNLYFDGTCVAVLPLTCGGNAHQIDALRMKSSWSAASKVNQLAFDPTVLSSYTLPAGASAQWMNWDLTSLVQSWLSGTNGNFGVLLKRSSEPTNASGPRPPSRNYAAEPTLGPTLEVTYGAHSGTLLGPDTVHANGAELHWLPYNGPGAPQFQSYEVHRSTDPNFTPSEATRLTTITDEGTTSYTDTTAKPGATFTYKVLVNGAETNPVTVALPNAGHSRKLLQPPAGVGTDTYVSELSGSTDCTNHGGESTMLVGTDDSSTWRSLVRFDLSDIPSSATIDSATLSLWHPDSPTVGLTINAHRVDAAWQAGTGSDACAGDGATWYETTGGVRWGTDGGDVDPLVPGDASVAAGAAPGWTTFDLASLVQDWVAGNEPNAGLLLKLDDEARASGKAVAFYTSDFTVAPTLRPKLSITYEDGSEAISPTVAISKPAAGDLVSGTTTINAGGYDDRRIDGVEFFVDGNSVGTDTSDPFSLSWNSATVGNGNHSLTARATDDAGNQTTSAAVSVTVGNSAAPSTAVTAPVNNASVSGTVTVNASANDDIGVTKVDFYADGQLIGTDSAAPYGVSWNTLDPAAPAYDGQHTLTSKAYDGDAQVTTSSAVDVTVANAANTEYLADFSSPSLPSRMDYVSGAQQQQSDPVDITLTNRSAQTWSASEVVLRYRWLALNDPTALVTSADIPLSADLGPGGQTTLHADVAPPDLPDGLARSSYRLRFDLYDSATSSWFAAEGNQPLEQTVEVGDAVDEAKLGVEPFYTYDSEDLGLGMRNLVNVATGNSLIQWSPMHAPGIGLSTDITLTYNSQEGECNHLFCPAGEGWSLGVSSFTRFGKQAFKPRGGEVDLTDADGTLLRFTADNGHWDPPAGTHLYLRRVQNDPDEPTADWAVTAPDRTTYYYKEFTDSNGDAEAFPLAVRDKNHNRLLFTLAGSGADQKLQSITDQGGREFDFQYYGPGDHEGRLESISDHSGHTYEFSYGDQPQQGDLVKITEDGGTNADGSRLDPRTVRFDYVGSGQGRQLVKVWDALGHHTDFSYLGNPHNLKLDTRTPRAGDLTQFSYPDANDTQVNAPLGRSTTYHYIDGGTDDGSVDQVTRVLTHGSPDFTETTETDWTTANEQAGRCTAPLDQPSREVWKVIEPHANGARQVYTESCYNKNGLVTDQFDQLGNQTHYDYRNLQVDANDPGQSISLLIKRTNPKGMLTSSDPNDYSWDYVYDAGNVNVMSVIDPPDQQGNRPETDYTYNSDGTVATAKDENQHTTQYNNYDLNGFPTEVIDGNGHITQYHYDDNGLLLWTQDPLHYGNVSQFSDGRDIRSLNYYDSFHRVGAQSSPKSTRFLRNTLIWSSTTYDANDNVLSESQPDYARGEGAATRYAYDPMDRQTCVRSPDPGGDTTFEYDAAGRLTRTISPNGNPEPGPSCPTPPQGDAPDSTVNVYDLFDRLVVQKQYDENAAPTRRTYSCYQHYTDDLLWVTAPDAGVQGDVPPDCNDVNGHPPAYTTRYSYDDAHEQLTVTEPLDTQNGQLRTHQYQYDPNGNVSREINEAGTPTDYTYTQRDELETTTETYTTSPARTLTSKLVYDGDGNVVREVSPRAWGACGQCDPGNTGSYVTVYHYDGADQLTSTDLPTDPSFHPTYVYRAYDANGNLTTITLPVADQSLSAVPNNLKTTLDYWDPGWIASSDNHVDPLIQYDYAAPGWQTLRRSEHSWGQLMNWTYYATGDVASQSDRYGGGSKYTYDRDGNQVTAEDLRTGSALYNIESTYDGYDNPLKTREKTSGSTWTYTKYSYDPNGNLTSREDDGTETQAGDRQTPGRLHTFGYDEADQLTMHEDLGTAQVAGVGSERIDITYKPTGWEDTRTLSRCYLSVCNSQSDWQPKIWTGRDYFDNGNLKSLDTRKESSTGALLEHHALDYMDANNNYVDGNRTQDTFTLASPDPNARCQTAGCSTSYEYGARENLIRETAIRPLPGDWTTRRTDWAVDDQMNVTDVSNSLDTGPTQLLHHYDYNGVRLTHSTDYNPTVDRYYFYQDGNLSCVTSAQASVCPRHAYGSQPDASLLATYAWDQRDRLAAFHSAGDAPADSTYTYDALDRVVSEQENHNGSNYSSDFTYLGLTDNVSSETDSVPGQPTINKSYSYGPDDERVGLSVNGTDYYYARNVHGDVSLLVCASAGAPPCQSAEDPSASYVYSPYGALDSLSSGDAEQPGLINAYRFNDMRLDTGSETTDMDARRYASDYGRFVQPDGASASEDELTLASDGLTQNIYAFAAGNPVTYSEINGHMFGDPGGRVGRTRKRKPWRISSKGTHFTVVHEGGNLPLYNDPNHNCTIGVGHLVHKGYCTGADHAKYDSWTPNQRLQLFYQDLRRFQNTLNIRIMVRLFRYEYDALLDFTFNIGTGGFVTSTALRDLNKGHYRKVPSGMMLWDQPPDILGRRCDEVRLFRTGRYTDSLRCPG